MIRLTNDASGEAGNPLYITPETITSIRPWGGTTRIDTADSKYFVTEFPEEVARKVLEWRLAMEDYLQGTAMVRKQAKEKLFELAGLEEKGRDE